jgi:hypothetical protein
MGIQYMLTRYVGIYAAYSFNFQKIKMYKFKVTGNSQDDWIQFEDQFNNSTYDGYLHTISLGAQLMY